jgi:hypothetical protein
MEASESISDPELLQGLPDDVKQGMRELLDEAKQDIEENLRSIRYETDARGEDPRVARYGAVESARRAEGR